MCIRDSPSFAHPDALTGWYETVSRQSEMGRKSRPFSAWANSARAPIQEKRKASPLDVKGVKLGVSTADLVAVVREGRERG